MSNLTRNMLVFMKIFLLHNSLQQNVVSLSLGGTIPLQHLNALGIPAEAISLSAPKQSSGVLFSPAEAQQKVFPRMQKSP